MRISIITAVYNRRETIAEAVGSLKVQTHPEIEHIVIDGGSTDGTMDIVKTRTGADTLIVSEPDDGIYDALNKGLKRASGEIVGVLHSDDLLAHPRVLEFVAEAFEMEAVDAVYGDLDYVARDDLSRIIRRWRSGKFTLEKLKLGWMPPHPALYLRRRVIEQHGGYDPSFRIAGDYDAILRYFSSVDFRAVHIPEVLIKMRVGGESNRSLSRVLKKSREDYHALRRNNIGGVRSLLCKNVRKTVQFF